MRRFVTAIGVMLGILLAIGTVSLRAQQENHTGSIKLESQDEAAFTEMARISLDTATNEALKQVPGKVVRAELENENGYLVYGVEIAKADHQIYDVKVDAGNGKVLKIDQDKKEVHEGEDSDNGHEETGER
jgi:uncharacterized membrane protein YkoI